MKKILEEKKEQLEKKIALYNEALHNGNFKTMNLLDIELKEMEAEYAQIKAKFIFDECLQQENPVKTAILKYNFNILSHKDEKEQGVIIKRVLFDDKVKQLDLYKFFEYAKSKGKEFDISWVYKIDKLNLLLTVRTARDLGYTSNEIASIETSFAMKDIAKKIELGETPDSTSQICKLMQTCIDAILFIDDGSGKNVIKVLNKDAKYLVYLYAKKGKSILSVQCAKASYLRQLITDIIYSILTNNKYVVEYKNINKKN